MTLERYSQVLISIVNIFTMVLRYGDLPCQIRAQQSSSHVVHLNNEPSASISAFFAPDQTCRTHVQPQSLRSAHRAQPRRSAPLCSCSPALSPQSSCQRLANRCPTTPWQSKTLDLSLALAPNGPPYKLTRGLARGSSNFSTNPHRERPSRCRHSMRLEARMLNANRRDPGMQAELAGRAAS